MVLPFTCGKSFYQYSLSAFLLAEPIAQVPVEGFLLRNSLFSPKFLNKGQLATRGQISFGLRITAVPMRRASAEDLDPQNIQIPQKQGGTIF